jgi:hypothetical protein
MGDVKGLKVIKVAGTALDGCPSKLHADSIEVIAADPQ